MADTSASNAVPLTMQQDDARHFVLFRFMKIALNAEPGQGNRRYRTLHPVIRLVND